MKFKSYIIFNVNFIFEIANRLCNFFILMLLSLIILYRILSVSIKIPIILVILLVIMKFICYRNYSINITDTDVDIKIFNKSMCLMYLLDISQGMYLQQHVFIKNIKSISKCDVEYKAGDDECDNQIASKVSDNFYSLEIVGNVKVNTNVKFFKIIPYRLKESSWILLVPKDNLDEFCENMKNNLGIDVLL